MWQRQFVLHEETLSKLLAENNKGQYKVEADGNCLYNAVCHQVRLTNPALTAETLRDIVCKQLLEQKDYYALFTENESNDFEEKVNKQMEPGIWDSKLGDLLPMVITNLFQCKLEIYSSGEVPIIKFEPTLEPPSSSLQTHMNTIQLTYLAVQGMEHYDSCMDKADMWWENITEDDIINMEHSLEFRHSTHMALVPNKSDQVTTKTPSLFSSQETS